jgi:hypothetical protein
MTTPAIIATNIVNKAKEYGFKIAASGCVITVHKNFTPGDNSAYCKAESEAYELVGMVKRTEPGSTWGGTSDGIGGMIAIQNGSMILHKSGCSKRILSQIAKINR